MNEKINSILQRYSFAQRDSLIPILQSIQDEVGFLSQEALILVGKHLNLPTSKIYGLATFYNQFKFESIGKYHIQVCNGTACHLMGSITVIDYFEKSLKIKAGQTTRNGLFSLEVVTCMGACSHSPVMVINGEYYRDITQESIRKLINSLSEEND